MGCIDVRVGTEGVPPTVKQASGVLCDCVWQSSSFAEPLCQAGMTHVQDFLALMKMWMHLQVPVKSAGEPLDAAVAATRCPT